jgi:PKD repeat protein
LLLSCGKKESAPSAVTPTNLTLNAVVSTDNSGNVSFTASATNASTYDFDFGNGVFQTVPSGIVTYKYPAAGTYTVNVIAKSSTGQTASKSTQITVAVAQSLVFSDEFDANGAPDPPNGIRYRHWFRRLGNNELQYYTNRLDNAFVSNGTLKIKAIKEISVEVRTRVQEY